MKHYTIYVVKLVVFITLKPVTSLPLLLLEMGSL